MGQRAVHQRIGADVAQLQIDAAKRLLQPDEALRVVQGAMRGRRSNA